MPLLIQTEEVVIKEAVIKEAVIKEAVIKEVVIKGVVIKAEIDNNNSKDDKTDIKVRMKIVMK